MLLLLTNIIAAVVIAVAAPARLATVDLVVDMSGNISADEARLQRQGDVRTMTDLEIINVLRGGPLGRIVVTYIEWFDVGDQRIIVD